MMNSSDTKSQHLKILMWASEGFCKTQMSNRQYYVSIKYAYYVHHKGLLIKA